MNLIKEVTLEIKKSKFIGLYYIITSESEAKEILAELKRNHKKARHLPYCYKIGNIVRKSDDKEPTNTAGTPIYNIVEKKNLDNCLIVVIRYFGGIKLGAGGLFRAYLEAANQATNKE